MQFSRRRCSIKLFKLTDNEVQFVCWGALTTVYLAVFVMISTLSRELLLMPLFGIKLATPISAVMAISISYAMIWHFVCHTNIPRRSWAKWFVGLQLATVFVLIETIVSGSIWQANHGLVTEAYHVFSTNLVITIVLISIIVAPMILSSQRNRGFNL